MLGQQIRNYRIQSLLGTGGMGSVYLAIHTQLGRRIAIKVIHPALARNPVVRERFRNEAAALSHLQHPNIVNLYDYSEEEDALYLFMEYVEGKTLDEYIGSVTGPVPEARAVPLFAKLLDAVAYAHDRGVIHRDIKPSNLMVTEDGNAKILDFGIAKLTTGQGIGALTKEGTRMGTVLYMSPEQVRGEVLDKRSDIYSLGVTLFQILTGRPPYDEASMTEYAVYQRILQEPLPEMRELYPLVTERMQKLVDRATAKDPASRFPDCHRFRDALLDRSVQPAPSLPGEPPLVVPPRTPAQSSAAWHETIMAAPENPPPVPAKPRRTRWTSVLLTAAILLSIVLIILALLPDGNENQTRRAAHPDTDAKVRDHAEEAPKTAETQPAIPPEKVPTEAETAPAPALPETTAVQEPAADSASTGSQFSQIGLEYEAVPPSDAGDSRSRFALKIVLSNTSAETAFDNVTLRIRFLSESGQVLGTYLYEHGRLEPGAVERFNVERRVQAANASCEVFSAQPVMP